MCQTKTSRPISNTLYMLRGLNYIILGQTSNFSSDILPKIPVIHYTVLIQMTLTWWAVFETVTEHNLIILTQTHVIDVFKRRPGLHAGGQCSQYVGRIHWGKQIFPTENGGRTKARLHKSRFWGAGHSFRPSKIMTSRSNLTESCFKKKSYCTGYRVSTACSRYSGPSSLFCYLRFYLK